MGRSELEHVLEDDHVLVDAGVGALLLHGGEVFGLEVDEALVVAGLLRLVQEVAH